MVVKRGEGRLTARDTPPKDQRKLASMNEVNVLFLGLVLLSATGESCGKVAGTGAASLCVASFCSSALCPTVRTTPAALPLRAAAALSPGGGHRCVKLRVTCTAETKTHAELQNKSAKLTRRRRTACVVGNLRGDIAIVCYFM